MKLAQHVGEAVVYAQVILQRRDQTTKAPREHGQVEPARTEREDTVLTEGEGAQYHPDRRRRVLGIIREVGDWDQVRGKQKPCPDYSHCCRPPAG